jgi:copper chaperone
MITTEIGVDGMTCGHCVRAVTEELSALPGVAAVEIALVPEGRSSVQITSASALEGDAVRAAVEEAGYEVATS